MQKAVWKPITASAIKGEKMILITGGSASGKSSYAEKEAVRLSEGGPLYYVAAMKPYGPKAQARISRHRRQRDGRGFISCEA